MRKHINTIGSFTKRSKIRVSFFIIAFAALGAILLSQSFAATNVSVSVDFGTLASQPKWYNYEQNHIRIQKTGGPEDGALLSALRTTNERSFIRLDKWKPTLSSPLKTEHGRFSLGDSWLEDMNSRGVAPWITQEIDYWKRGDSGWFLNPPLDQTDYNNYENILYDIVKYIKQKSPQTKIVEMFNEPNCLCVSRSRKLTITEQVELYVRNARVVNRLNADLALPRPGSPKLVSGGPSMIGVGVGNGDLESWLDGVYANSTFTQIKPAFVSFHNFTGRNAPASYKDLATRARSIMSQAKYNGAWNSTEVWITAYNISDNDTTIRDPVPTETARWSAGMAATHYYMMEANVANASMFAQSSYVNHNSSLLLPIGTYHNISYYRPGTKTALYNYFDMMSQIQGQRVRVASGSLDSTGKGFGTDAVRGNGKAWILSWNYNYPGVAADNNPTYEIKGLSQVGIADTRAAIAKVYRIDASTSNIASGNHTEGNLKLVQTVNLPAGSVRRMTLATTGFTTLMVEITPDNSSVTLSANPSSVNHGGVTTLTWSSSNIVDNSCSLTSDPANLIPNSFNGLSSGGVGANKTSSVLNNSSSANITVKFTIACRNQSGELITNSTNVIVNSNTPNIRPIVNLLTPTQRVKSKNILFSVNASAASGLAISKVEFYDGNSLIGFTTTPNTLGNFNFNWSPNKNGDYLISVKAIDSNNNFSTSEPVNIRVRRPDINNDGVVNGADINLIVDQYGRDDKSCDLDENGSVGIEDVAVAVVEWK